MYRQCRGHLSSGIDRSGTSPISFETNDASPAIPIRSSLSLSFSATFADVTVKRCCTSLNLCN